VPTTVTESEAEVSPEQVVAEETPEGQLALTGTDVVTLTMLGAALAATGFALLHWRRGARRTG
jgi:LPXTG-motif cell wall-anchored protein